MCGLFGFSGPGRGDRLLLGQIAGLAGRRGPDAWGVWADGRRHANMGRVTAQAVAAIPAPRTLIGHARLATVLDTKRPECCQPIRAGRWVVAHNGTVPNVQALSRRFGFSLSTGVDSEAIAHLLAAMPLHQAMSHVDHRGHFAVSALDAKTGAVELLAVGLPIWAIARPEGRYWCSVRPGDGWEAIHA